MPYNHKKSIATVCVAGTLEEKLRAISDAGFEAVELFEPDLQKYPGTPTDLKNLCSSLNLEIIMYQPFRDLDGWPTKEEFVKALERFNEKLQIMEELEVDTILVVSNCQPNAVRDFGQQVEHLRLAARLAASHGKRIAYEALGWGTKINLWRDSYDLVLAVNEPNFGLCLDTFHIFSRFDSIEDIGDIRKDKLFMVQLADAPYFKEQPELLTWSRNHRTFPLLGEMPVVEFMVELEKTGYDGPLSHEVFSEFYRKADPGETARKGMESFVLLEQAVRDRTTDIERL